MLDPNKAYRNRKEPEHKVIRFTAGDHPVTFTCPNCGHTYDTVFHKGTALYPNQCWCPECHKANMNYHIGWAL